jgi:hypothetical protein
VCPPPHTTHPILAPTSNPSTLMLLAHLVNVRLQFAFRFAGHVVIGVLPTYRLFDSHTASSL